MHEVKAVTTQLPEGPNAGYVVAWSGLGTDTAGFWESHPGYPSKTVTIEGAARRLRLEGRNRVGEAEGFPLVDAIGLPITACGIYALTVNPLQIRPVVEDGAAVTVTLLVAR